MLSKYIYVIYILVNILVVFSINVCCQQSLRFERYQNTDPTRWFLKPSCRGLSKMGNQYATSLAPGIILLFILRAIYKAFVWKSKYKLPVTVPGVPVFGNTFQIPASQQGPWAKQLAQKYGEMYDRLPSSTCIHKVTTNSYQVYMQVRGEYMGVFEFFTSCYRSHGTPRSYIFFAASISNDPGHHVGRLTHRPDAIQ